MNGLEFNWVDWNEGLAKRGNVGTIFAKKLILARKQHYKSVYVNLLSIKQSIFKHKIFPIPILKYDFQTYPK